ncbi:MAG: transcriptional regulator [Rariglobus sp.]|jgi:LacI family transcriptional regulator|nr:transcriptional regulator [Rariglobus sp.]
MRPHYQSLSTQVASDIETNLHRGAWLEWLPGERSLAESHQISRKTLRKALRILQERKLIAARHGLGYLILKPEKSAQPENGGLAPGGSIGLLTPLPVHALRPYTALWVNELGTMLAEHDERLRVFSGRKYFSQNPACALQRLVTQHPQRCWLLSHSNEKIQRWFAGHDVPCIITGSAHPGVDLPNIDLDHRAVCRHAAAAMLRLGHRKIALINERSGRVGDSESESGFMSGLQSFPDARAECMVAHHDGSIPQTCRLVDRLLALAEPPTALLIVQPLSYVTVVTHLAQRGLRVPQDISVMCRDDDGFLEYVRPEPSRYACRAHLYAKKLLNPVLALAAGEPVAQRVLRIIPTHRPGGSLARVPASSGDKRTP